MSTRELRRTYQKCHALNHELADLADQADMESLAERGRARMN
jgi:hypothetical protein